MRNRMTEPHLPSFLPTYYAPAFSTGRKSLGLVSQGETNGVTQYVYSTADEDLALSVENIQGNKPKCDAVFNNMLGYLNQLITSNKGAFVEITATEACVEVTSTNAVQTFLTYILPSSVQIWTFSQAPTDRGGLTADFKTIRKWANRQRYEEALQAGNVSMGRGQKCIQGYAKDLLESGRKDDALIVLKNFLATASFDYEAHLEFMGNTPNSASATNSAKTVFKNAESPASIMSYHMMLGKTLHETYDSRQRLVERIAKELVPASLKQLGIPRSTDPTCPYSYSSGVDRLDQKTLTLSDQIKEALNKLRDPITGASVP